MMKKLLFRNTAVGVILTLISACSTSSEKFGSRTEQLPYYDDASFTPIWLSKGDNEQQELHKIPSFKLVNQIGDTVTEKTFEGKIYITDFFFTSCPGICPKMTKNMSILQDVFREDEDVLLLSHSVTPSQDSVEVLSRYADMNEIDEKKWHLVTGDRDHIYDLGRRAYFVEEDLGIQKEDDEFLHTENFVLVDRNRHLRGIYNGLDKNSIKQLIEDVKTLKKESIQTS